MSKDDSPQLDRAEGQKATEQGIRGRVVGRITEQWHGDLTAEGPGGIPNDTETYACR